MKVLMIVFGAALFLLLTLIKFIKSKTNKKVNVKNLKANLKVRSFFFLKGEQKKEEKVIQMKVENNFPSFLNEKINYEMLTNAGIFTGKEIYKIYISKLDLTFKKEILIANNFLSNLNVDLLLLCENKKVENLTRKFLQNFSKKVNAKFLNMQDLASNLFFEINKLNINYEVQNIENFSEGVFISNQKVNYFSYKNYRLESKCVVNNILVTSYKLINFNEDENILNYKNLSTNKIFEIKNTCDKNQKFNFKYVKKLPHCFFEIAKEENALIIKDFNNHIDKIYFSNKNFKYFIKKSEKNVFLIVLFENFKLSPLSSLIVCICANEKNIIDKLQISNLLLNNYLNAQKFFDVKFESQNDFLNKFINKKIPNIFCKSVLLNRNEKLDVATFSKIKNLKEIEKLSQTKLNTKKFIKILFNSLLGIKVENSKVQISPKIDISNFQIEVLVDEKKYLLKYFKTSNGKTVVVDGIEFVNLSALNLNCVKGNEITFCS